MWLELSKCFWVLVWQKLEVDGWLEHQKDLNSENIFSGLERGYGVWCTRHYIMSYPEMFVGNHV